MTPKDTAAIKLAIKKYWTTKTDEDLARSIPGTTPDTIRRMRLELNLKGTESLKDYGRRYLLEMSDAEKKEFMQRLPAELIWKMGEGQPATSGEITVNQEPILINITHQLQKVYGPRIIDQVPGDGEGGRLTTGSGE